MLTFFRRAGHTGTGTFVPLPEALAHWGGGQLHGPAVAGILARGGRLTAAEVSPEFVPGRSAVELFRPTFDRPVEIRTEVVRAGSRILVVDAFLVQDGRTTARAHLFFFRPSAEPGNAIWAPPLELPIPGPGVELDEQSRCYRRENTRWSPRAAEINGPGCKYSWQAPVAVVDGEGTDPFELLAATSDLTSLSTHWEERGIGFINTDATMSIGRLPKLSPAVDGPASGVLGGVGVRALGRVGDSGVSAGSAVMYDSDGPLALSMVSALAQTSVRVAITPNGFETERL